MESPAHPLTHSRSCARKRDEMHDLKLIELLNEVRICTYVLWELGMGGNRGNHRHVHSSDIGQTATVSVLFPLLSFTNQWTRGYLFHSLFIVV